jgi:hypothetical protein
MRNGALGLVGVVLVLAGEVGCSSGGSTVDNGAGGSGPDPVIDRSKPLSELTPAEISKICRDLAPDLASVSCDLAGFVAASYAAAYDQSLTDQQLQATCTQFSGTCQSQQPPPDCAGAAAAPTDCSATVDEYFTCIDDTLAEIPSCGTLTRQLLSSSTPSLDNPKSCNTLEAKCPGLDH